MDAKKLRTFLEVTMGGRSPGQTRTSTPAAPAEEAVGVNGASVSDIRNLIDYVAPPEQGLPSWAANRTVWNAAMAKVGVASVANNEPAYEAVALTYHDMGGELVTAEDNEEEVEIPESFEDPINADLLSTVTPDGEDAALTAEIEQELAAEAALDDDADPDLELDEDGDPEDTDLPGDDA